MNVMSGGKMKKNNKIREFLKKRKGFTEQKIYLELGENYPIPKESTVKVITIGNQKKVKHSKKNASNLRIYKRKSNDEFIDTRTGEIKQYKRNKLKGAKQIKQNLKNLEQYIQAYFHDDDNLLFLTLTCRDKTTKLEKIQNNTSKFFARLRRQYPQYKFMYVYKFEQQENLNWHVHIILKTEKNQKIFIPKQKLEKMWQQGWTYIEVVENGNVREEILNNESKEIEANNQNQSKSQMVTIKDYLIKTNQLTNVPSGTRIYGKSRNLKAPKVEKKKYKEVIEELDNNYEFEAEKTILVENAEGKILNKHKTETYRKKKDKRNS